MPRASTPSTTSSCARRARWTAWTRAARVTLDDGDRLAVRPPAARDRRRAAPPPHTRRRARRRALPAQRRRLRRAARAPRRGRQRRGRRRRLDRLRGRRLGPPARARRDRDRPAGGPARARARGGGRARSTATSTRDHGVRHADGHRSGGVRGRQKVERVRTSDGATLECDFVVVGVGVQPRTGLAAEAGMAVDDGVLVDARLRTGADGVFAAGDVASAPPPLLRRAHPCRALGERAEPGPGGGAQHARPGRALRATALLLLRPVRRRHGVLRLRTRAGTASSSAATRPPASSSPSGWTATACSRG